MLHSASHSDVGRTDTSSLSFLTPRADTSSAESNGKFKPPRQLGQSRQSTINRDYLINSSLQKKQLDDDEDFDDKTAEL